MQQQQQASEHQVLMYICKSLKQTKTKKTHPIHSDFGNLHSKPASPQILLTGETFLVAPHDFGSSLGSAARTTHLRGWWGNKPHDLARRHNGREGSTPELCELEVFTSPMHSRIPQQLQGPGTVPTLMELSRPLPGGGWGAPPSSAYLWEALHILGQRAHPSPLVVLQQLQDGWIHRVIWWDRPKEVRVFLLIC